MTHEHSGVVADLLYLPIVILLFLAAMQAGAAAGVAGAGRFLGGWERSPDRVKGIAFLLAISAAVHLALVPQHLSESRALAALFTLDAAALGAMSIGVFVLRRWKLPVGILLAGGLGAYAFYAFAGLEDVDAIGLVTKLLELTALVLVVTMPQGRSTPSGAGPTSAGAGPQSIATTRHFN